MDHGERGRASVAILGAIVCAASARAGAAGPPASPRTVGLSASLTPVARFDHVPVGVAVSREHRIFLAFSRAVDADQPFSVAELRQGRPVAFPPGLGQDAGARGDCRDQRLVSAQALAVDARDRLWILDCARVGNADPADPAAIKLLAVDLASGAVVRTITFPRDVAGPTRSSTTWRSTCAGARAAPRTSRMLRRTAPTASSSSTWRRERAFGG